MSTQTIPTLSDEEMAATLVRWAKSFIVQSEKQISRISEQMAEAGVKQRIDDAVEKERARLGEDSMCGFGPPNAAQLYEQKMANLNASMLKARIGHQNNHQFLAFIEKTFSPTSASA